MTKIVGDARTSLEELIGELAIEFSDRLRAGEKPDVDEYARRYPEAADAIRQILPALEIMGEAPGSELSAAESVGGEPQRGMIGEYRIIREIGRGGMGVVYEAEQLSLSRRVALKVLPFAAVLDERQVKRFRNEAMAAAQLDHPHIVNVYGVGCERSVHFYAMRYVEGEPLSHVIEQLSHAAGAEGGAGDPAAPTLISDVEAPENGEAGNAAGGTRETAVVGALSTQRSATGREYFRSVARIGVEVAGALDYAHQQGVIHRDIKPANIMIDATGKSWVTDFGLARMESGATLTMTGDLLGTLRYMSPEQALAKRVVVDHRTDVYSLGVTLYELLTLRPAYEGDDRHDLLRKIAFEEPKPPRKLNRAVPEELETIVLKALAKNPNDRYDTAQELADDLQRYLDDRPIRARRPGLLQIAGQWTRRHRRVVATAVSILVVAVIGLSISVGLITHERNLARTAAEKENLAATQATTQRNEAHRQAREAERQKRRAEDNVDLALQALDEIYVRLADERFTAGRELQDADREFLEKAVTFYEQVAEQKQNDHQARRSVASAQFKIGRIYERLGLHEQGQEAFRTALGRYESLLVEADDRETRLQHVDVLTNLAGSLKATSDYDESVSIFEEAIAIYENDHRTHPDYDRTTRDLAWCHAHRGDALSRLGRRDEAVASLKTAVEHNRELAQQFPKNSWYRRELAIHLDMLATVLSPGDDAELTAQLRTESVAEFELLEQQSGGDETEGVYIARNLGARADLLQNTLNAEQLEEAIHLQQERIEQWRYLVGKAPANLDYRRELAWALNRYGQTLERADRSDDALIPLDESSELLDRMLEFWPKDEGVYNARGFNGMIRGDIARRAGRFDEAEETFVGAAGDFERANISTQITWSLKARGDLAFARGNFTRAAELYRRLHDYPADHPEVASNSNYQARVQTTQLPFIRALYASQQADEARPLWEAMLNTLPNAAVQYRLRIDEPGPYRLFVRTTAETDTGRYLFVRIRELWDGPGGSMPDWYYVRPATFDGDYASAPSLLGHGSAWFEGTRSSLHPMEPMVWDIPVAGEYTLEVLGAVFGTGLDRFVFQNTQHDLDPPGDALPESPRAPDGAFLAADGRFVVDGVHFDARRAHQKSGKQWLIVPGECADRNLFANSASGEYLQLLPDEGNGGGSPLFTEFATDEERAEGIAARADHFLELFPKDIDARLTRAAGYQRQKQYANAITDYSAAIELLEQQSRAWKADHAGELIPGNNSPPAAVAVAPPKIESAADVLAKPGETPVPLPPCMLELSRALQLCADAHYSLGDDLAAISDLRRAAAMDSTNVSLLKRIGWQLHDSTDPRVKDREQSLDYVRRAVELAPESSALQAQLGRFIWDLEGDREAALEHIDRAIEIDPRNVFAYVQRECVNRRNPELALADLERALDINPDYPYALRHRAEIRESMGELEKALEDYNRVAALDSNRTNLSLNYRRRAGLYNRLGNPEAAIADLDRALELRPNDREALSARARTLFEIGRFEAGVADSEKYLELTDHSASACNVTAWIVARNRDVPLELTEQALLWARKAVELGPTRDDCWYTRGVAEYRVGHWNEAIAAFHSSCTLIEGRNLGWDALFLAMAEHQLGHDAQADLWYRAGLLWMIRHAPEHSDLLRFRDEAARLLTGSEPAEPDPDAPADDIGAFTLAIEAAPDAGWPYAGRARAHLELEHWGEAVADFSQGLGEYEAGFRPWYELGLLQAWLDKTDGYRETCRKMIEKFAGSDDETARQFAVWTSSLLPRTLDEYATAVDVAEKLVAQHPDDPGLQQGLGAILFRAGRLDEALAALSAAERLRAAGGDVSTTSPAYLWYLLAMVHADLGHTEQARNWLRQANELAEQELTHADNPVLWNRKLTLQRLRNEAEGLLQAEPSAGDPETAAPAP